MGAGIVRKCFYIKKRLLYRTIRFFLFFYKQIHLKQQKTNKNSKIANNYIDYINFHANQGSFTKKQQKKNVPINQPICSRCFPPKKYHSTNFFNSLQMTFNQKQTKNHNLRIAKTKLQATRRHNKKTTDNPRT